MYGANIHHVTIFSFILFKFLSIAPISFINPLHPALFAITIDGFLSSVFSIILWSHFPRLSHLPSFYPFFLFCWLVVSSLSNVLSKVCILLTLACDTFGNFIRFEGYSSRCRGALDSRHRRRQVLSTVWRCRVPPQQLLQCGWRC